MKQPDNEIITSGCKGQNTVAILTFGRGSADIASAATKQRALRIAIRRLHRLSVDAEKLLDKLE